MIVLLKMIHIYVYIYIIKILRKKSKFTKICIF